MKLFSFDEYSSINEGYTSFETEMDTLTEGIVDVIASPVKYTKIKNNAKNYQQALVQKATLDLDLARKKSKSDSAKETEVYKKAYDTKKSAISDTISSLADRMDDLATTDMLKKVVKLAKHKSKIAAAKTSLKAADGELAKELSATIAKEQKKSSEVEKEIKAATKKSEPTKSNDTVLSKEEMIKKKENELKLAKKKYDEAKFELKDATASGNAANNPTYSRNVKSSLDKIEKLKNEIKKLKE